MAEFTIDDLRRIVLECAGQAEANAWDGDVLDTTFEELGYDSIAMFEVAGRIHREFGTRLEDGAVVQLRTPRAFITRVGVLLAYGQGVLAGD